jgi:hypothetical protein
VVGNTRLGIPELHLEDGPQVGYFALAIHPHAREIGSFLGFFCSDIFFLFLPSRLSSWTIRSHFPSAFARVDHQE